MAGGRLTSMQQQYDYVQSDSTQHTVSPHYFETCFTVRSIRSTPLTTLRVKWTRDKPAINEEIHLKHSQQMQRCSGGMSENGAIGVASDAHLSP
jgi:hypothetical protein